MTDRDDEAALACVGALTAWVHGDESGLDMLEGTDPVSVTAFLFGQFAAAIDLISELTGMTQEEFVQELAMDVQLEIMERQQSSM